MSVEQDIARWCQARAKTAQKTTPAAKPKSVKEQIAKWAEYRSAGSWSDYSLPRDPNYEFIDTTIEIDNEKLVKDVHAWVGLKSEESEYFDIESIELVEPEPPEDE